MGLQLIFAVEADPKCKSDWIYIKDTIEQFYRYERTQVKFLDNAQRYCKERNADFVWFCKDIEQVYTGNSVDKGRKKNEAVSFKVKKKIGELRAEKLTHVEYRNGVSNIMTVLDQYLERK